MGTRVIIAAGGTGGHIFPAVHIGESLRENGAVDKVLFIGTGRPLEQRIIDRAGFDRREIPAVPVMQNGILGILKFILTFPYVLFTVFKIFREFKPDVVVGVGGYVTVPPVILAWLFGIPTWIHEAELTPGLANKLLSYFATKISIAFKGAEIGSESRVLYTGHPVRRELRDIGESAVNGEVPKNLLIIGGSLGARALDLAMVKIAPLLKDLSLEVWHQCREENLDQLVTAYKSAGITARVVTFIDQIDQALAWSDLVISRAGAGTIMELSVVNRPAILVPYPFAQGGHQKNNAMTLVDQGKAVLVEEGEAFEPRLSAAISELSSSQKYLEFRSRRADSRSVDAAQTIAQGIISLHLAK